MGRVRSRPLVPRSASIAWLRLAGLAVTTAGCAQPAADVVVAWLDDTVERDGVRALQIYDRGERYILPVQTEIAGTRPSMLGLAVDVRGAGVALSGDQTTVYQSLRKGRRPVLDGRALGTALSSEFSLTRNGDAIVRAYEDETGAGVVLMPTSSEAAGAAQRIAAPPGGGEIAWISAAAAPIVFGFAVAGRASGPQGFIQAIAYPSDDASVLPPVSSLTMLGTADTVIGRGIDSTLYPGRLDPGICSHRLCVAPDGRSATMMAGPCALWWWTWEDAAGASAAEPRYVELPPGCPESSDPFLFAQLDHDVVALDDDDRIYLADLTAQSLASVPKLGVEPMAISAQRGAAVTVVSRAGQMVHVSPEGAFILNPEQGPCGIAGGGASNTVRLSPNGLWAVQSCVDVGEFGGTLLALLVRISSLGQEQFLGVPMAPLAIDDEGNVVMYSYETTSDSTDMFGRSPRGLFVFDSASQLVRVDDLDPEPAEVRGETGNRIRFAVSNAL